MAAQLRCRTISGQRNRLGHGKRARSMWTREAIRLVLMSMTSCKYLLFVQMSFLLMSMRSCKYLLFLQMSFWCVCDREKMTLCLSVLVCMRVCVCAFTVAHLSRMRCCHAAAFLVAVALLILNTLISSKYSSFFLFNSSSMRFLCVWCVQVRRRAPRLSRGDRSMRSSLVLHLAHPPQRRLAPPTCISHSFPHPYLQTMMIWHVCTHTHTHEITLLLLQAGCPRARPERPAALECHQPAEEETGKRAHKSRRHTRCCGCGYGTRLYQDFLSLFLLIHDWHHQYPKSVQMLNDVEWVQWVAGIKKWLETRPLKT